MRGRSPVVLSDRREQVEGFAEALKGKVRHVVLLLGGMGRRQLKDVRERLLAIPDSEPRVILATGSFLGEGFDDARLDTLFLASPISWKGRLTQFAGRLHRLHDGKREVRIYDYVDVNVAVCARMYDLLDAMHKLAVMLDVSAELSDLDAYRRARREDWFLQRNGYRVVRLLAEDVCARLDETLAFIECKIR